MMQCHALKSPLARIEGTIDTVVFADGVVREDIVLVSNPITIGLNTDEQQSVVRYDMVERSSGLTIKTYTNPVIVFSEYWNTMQINANENASAIRTFSERVGDEDIFKVTIFGVVVRYEVVTPAGVMRFKTRGEALNWDGSRPPMAPTAKPKKVAAAPVPAKKKK